MYWAFWKGEVVRITWYDLPADEDQACELATLFPEVIYFEEGHDGQTQGSTSPSLG
jgi:hypothetical protein